MVTMTERQLAFWRALLAPFRPEELSEVPARGGKRTLTYLDSRALMNRLDSVCGPHGWDIEYRPTERGYTARMGILVPTGNDSWLWLYKEDGAGFEEMGGKNRETGEWEADVDNDEKSGYTNALRRVAQNAWGIGRYLYQKGIPSFLDPNAQPLAQALTPARPPEPAREPTPAAPPSPSPAAPQSPAPAQVRPEGAKTFRMPKPGKGVFAWAKEVEQHFQTSIINGMKETAKSRGWDTMFTSWDQDQINHVCGDVIGYLKSLDNYAGEFDEVQTGAQRAAATATAASARAASEPIADLKRKLWAAVKALIQLQTGADATDATAKEAVVNISAEARNGQGHAGEVLDSLSACDDAIWVENMLLFTKNQIDMAQRSKAAESRGGDDIPF